MAPLLTIRIKKNTDGSAALTLHRADGSSTWQRQRGNQGAFFPFHDMTHYAVETVMRFDGAFYGLVASGWDFADFMPPYPRGPIPAEAIEAEIIVGFLDAERASRAHGEPQADAVGFAEQVRLRADAMGVEPQRRTPTDDELRRIRARVGECFERWREVAPGDALSLSFPPG